MGVSTDPLAWLAQLEGVASAYAATRDGIDVMLRDRGLRQTDPATTAEALAVGAHASAVLEGSTSTLADLDAGVGDEIAQDSLRLSTEVLALTPQLKLSPAQVFARLHAVAAATALPAEQLGRPRDAESAQRLQELGQLVLGSTEVPALLLAAVVHAEIATAAPFPSHNGVVARAAERLVLVARGVDPKALMVPEAGHLALRPQYESNLSGYASGQQRGLHAWVLYAAEAYAKGMELSPLRPVKKPRRDRD